MCYMGLISGALAFLKYEYVNIVRAHVFVCLGELWATQPSPGCGAKGLKCARWALPALRV